MSKSRYLSLCLMLSLPVAVYTQNIKLSDAQKVGISSKRLSIAHGRLEAAISSHTIGSAVGLIARSGQIVFLESVGEAAPGVPMPDDAIVRTASITKPITAVAVLILYERGLLRLTDPVEKDLPEFRDLKVEVSAKDGQGASVVNASRPITIYDLLTHQAGLVASYDVLDKLYTDSKTAREFSLGLAKLPLRFQPGTQYEYGESYELLAAIIEKLTGRTYDKFLGDEVLSPLRMNDTYFFVPPEKRPRLVAQYRRDATGSLVMDKARGQEQLPTSFYSGGGGLRSTVRDYYRFAEFLLNEGELDGVRLLSPKTIRLMTTNHVGLKYPDEGYGWGLGVEVRTSLAGSDIGSVGSYGWNGGTGTLFLVDPRERLIVIIFAPTRPGTRGVYEFRQAFVTDAYQAIVESYDRSAKP